MLGEMEKLKLVIGPAPSELPYEQLLEKLSVERERMTTMLAKKVRTKRKASTPRKSRAKKLSAKEVKDINELIEGLI